MKCRKHGRSHTQCPIRIVVNRHSGGLPLQEGRFGTVRHGQRLVMGACYLPKREKTHAGWNLLYSFRLST
jgi:hypothetical protein